MKYNEELFNMSSQLYPKTYKTNEDKREVEIKFFKILLTKIKDILDSPQNINNGIIKIKFISRVFGTTDEGYELIKELVTLNKIYSFANDYCIYINCKEYSDDQFYSTYYEVIWDYKTYFENINKNEKNLQKYK